MSVDAINPTAATGIDPSRARIAGAIKQAASTTGTSFEYLLATAKMESNFNPKASATTSSARGLYQFIDQTWLGTVKEAGSLLGYGKYADAITKSSSGNYSVGDPAARDAIMKLRDDPDAASSMAAVLTQRYDSAANSSATRSAMASAGVMPASGTFASAAAGAAPIDNAAYLSSFPDSSRAASQPALKTASLQPSEPIFRSLFQAGERSEPVSPAVHELWGSSSSLTSVAPATSVAPTNSVTITSPISALPTRTPNVRAPQPLDLFSDRSGA